MMRLCALSSGAFADHPSRVLDAPGVKWVRSAMGLARTIFGWCGVACDRVNVLGVQWDNWRG